MNPLRMSRLPEGSGTMMDSMEMVQSTLSVGGSGSGSGSGSGMPMAFGIMSGSANVGRLSIRSKRICKAPDIGILIVTLVPIGTVSVMDPVLKITSMALMSLNVYEIGIKSVVPLCL